MTSPEPTPELDRASPFDRLIGPARVQWFRQLGQKLLYLGTDGYDRKTRRRLGIMNVVAYALALATLSFSINQMSWDASIYWPAIVLNASIIPLLLITPFMHRFHETAGGLWVVFVETIAVFVFAYLLGRDAGVQQQYVIAASATFVILGLKRMKLILAIILGAFVLNLLAWFSFPASHAFIQPNANHTAIANSLYFNSMLSTFGMTALTVYYAFSVAQRAQDELDSLLKNILPETIAERLMVSPEKVIADGFDEATLLFADLVGFTPLSKELGPDRTVEMLNEIVSELDGIADELGVEKIKTMGDAYMAASGVPEHQDHHCAQMARLALRVRDAVRTKAKSKGIDIDVRIGMATGPVLAGVIGKRKFTYDVWGDTVNLASRMESHSEVGRIHVDQKVKDCLGDRFEFERRGEIVVKGIGPVVTWYLIGEKS